MSRRTPARWRQLALGAAVAVLMVAPLWVRERFVRQLEEEYGRIVIGGDPPPGLHVEDRPPPARYQNMVFWRTSGSRERCVRHAVRHGKLLAGNFAYVVGFDVHGKVAFKSLGNT